MNIKCSKCNLDKTEEEFSWKYKNKRRSTICKECHNKYSKKHYLDNKEEYSQRLSKWRIAYKKANKDYILNYLKQHPCVDCGESDPVVLEFDHIVPSSKEYHVSIMVGNSLNTIKKEIEKCEVRCANCHRRRHSLESGCLS